MKTVRIIRDGETLLPQVEAAFGFFARLRGLMFRRSMPEDCGLLLRPCNQIHSFFMRFSFDAVYISKTGEVLKVEPNIPRGRSCKTVRGAESVLELCGGAAGRLSIAVGDILTVE